MNQARAASKAPAKPRDPVCGMAVSDDTDNRMIYAGREYLFCSEHCLHKFKESPQQYIEPKAAPAPQTASMLYTCPMHPEVQQPEPGDCPKCGMALEPMGVPAPATRTEYTCPMHPEIVQDHPGNCPKCGMALEPRTVAVEEEENEELRDMSRRFWVSAMAAEFWPEQMAEIIDPRLRQWLELILATPAVVWGGWIFYVRAVQSVITRNLNMFTLIGLGVAVAWTYSVVAAGVLYPFFGILLSPIIAAAAMSFSSVSVIFNALRLRRVSL